MLISQLSNPHIILIILWLLYFAIHSLLASLSFKQFVLDHTPRFMPWYRLTFNAFAVFLLIPPLFILYAYPGNSVWQWTGVWFYLANGLALMAVGGFFWSMGSYDNGEFLGTRQLQEGRIDVKEKEAFRLSTLHRYVRHPWYSFGLVLIWTRDMNESMLITAILLTAYFIIGSYLEEKKLIAFHGEKYRLYKKRVAGLVPLPWRFLSKENADEIVALDERG